MRQLNRSLVIELLRRGEPMSRSALARTTGLSNTTMTNVVGELLRERLLLLETAGEPPSKRSKPRTTLRINNAYGLAAGLEVTDSTATAVVTDWSAEALATVQRALPATARSASVIAELIEVLEEALSKARTAVPADLRGIGIALSGLVDVTAGVSVAIPGRSSWSSVQARKVFETHFDVPVAIDWRVYAAALAEMWLGAARDQADFLYVNVGSGIAMASVVNRSVVRREGALAGQAGLLGHIMVEPNGKRCDFCGNHGCLDTYSAIPAIVEAARKSLQQSTGTSDGSKEPNPVSAFQDVVDAAMRGDESALDARMKAAKYLGVAVAYLLHLQNPSLVIIGGEIASFGEAFLDEVRASVREHSLPRSFWDADLVLSELRPDSATLGAACLVLMLANIGRLKADQTC